MNIIERIDRPCEYVEVAQTALIACQYLYLWLFAGPDDAYKVYSLAILMAFEFVMVHSGLFMAAFRINLKRIHIKEALTIQCHTA